MVLTWGSFLPLTCTLLENIDFGKGSNQKFYQEGRGESWTKFDLSFLLAKFLRCNFVFSSSLS